MARIENAGTASQKTTRYLVDTDTTYAQVIEERAPETTDAAGAAVLQARYVWGQGLAPLAMWRKGDDGVVRLHYFLADGQESVRQLTTTSGVVSDSYHFDAFGRSLAGGSGDTVNPFRYTGQQLDSDGRYYLRARFYNPGNGRFLSHDPLLGNHEDPISMHRYLYAANDGVNFNDPSGQSFITTAVGVVNSMMSNIALRGTVMVAGTTALNFVTTQIVTANVLNHWASKNTLTDGVLLTLGLSGQTGGASFGANLSLYVERDTADVYLFLSGEVGLSPLSLFKKHRGFASATSVGLVFNTDSESGASSLSGDGFNAYWPTTMARFAFRGLKGENMLKPYSFLTRFADRNLNSKVMNTIGFSHSVGGAAIISLSVRNNSFGFSGGRTSQPVLLGNLGTFVSDVKMNSGGNLKNLIQAAWDACWEFSG